MQRSNPFATRFIRPGALAYIFPSGQSVESLVGQLRERNWQGQIVGPHGSGKSTLVTALAPALEEVGRRVVFRQTRSRESGVGSRASGRELDSLSAEALNADTQVVIDGFEQVSWLARRRVKDVCRRTGAGLLVTTHRDAGLPTLYRTELSLELARAVVARLLPSGDTSISPDDVARAFESRGGDIRETLFALYDVYQQKAGENHELQN